MGMSAGRFTQDSWGQGAICLYILSDIVITVSKIHASLTSCPFFTTDDYEKNIKKFHSEVRVFTTVIEYIKQGSKPIYNLELCLRWDLLKN